MFKHNLTACLNSQRPDKKGLYPLRIRSTIKRVVTYYPTGIMLKKEQWDGTEVIKHENKVRLNVIVQKKISELAITFSDQYLSGSKSNKIQKTDNPTFKQFAEKVIKNQTGVLSAGRIEQKEVYKNKFAEFNESIRLKDITKDTLISFENFCRDRGNSENTIHSNTSFVKSILTEAKKEGFIKSSPGEGFKGARYVDPMRIVLTPDEIQKFENYADDLKRNKTLRQVAAWFVFSCYTGLRYGDLEKFKGFVNGRVLLQTQKTDEVVSIFATDKIIKAKDRLTSSIITNQKMNSYLKDLAVTLEIDKRITVHLARHSFAVNFLAAKGDIFILSKILGHTNLKVTQIYAKLSSEIVDAEMRKVHG